MVTHISRIEIQNFRNFRHLILDPFPARAVVVGENAVGKSNLLQALRLILDPSLPDSMRALRSEEVFDGGPSLGQGVAVSVSIELSGFDNDVDAKAILSKSIIKTQPLTARLTYRYRPRADKATQADDGSFQLADPNKELTRSDYDFIVFCGDDEVTDARRVRRDIALRVLNALRDAESDLGNWRRNPLRDLLEGLPLDPSNLKQASDAIKLAVDKLRTDPSVATLEGLLTRRLESMTGPRLLVDPALGFASTEPGELIKSVRLYIDQARTRQVSEASLGGANVIYLGLLLEALQRQRLDDAFISVTLAVEEPEAHLHVGLQRRLFHYLLRSEPTLILTTHSPHVAAVSPLNSLVVLRSTPGGTVGKTTAGLVLESDTQADLERYMDVSRAELLFAAGVVLVEGLAEVYLIPALAKASGLDLDGCGIVVTSVHGVDFAPYVKLLGRQGLNSPFVVLTDGDPEAAKPAFREGGLRRSIGTHALADDLAANKLLIGALPETTEPAYAAQRMPLIEAAAALGFYVGKTTLEIDLAATFGEQMLAAFNELSSTNAAREDVAAGVANELEAAPNPLKRSAMLERIKEVGKGRFAQRLAAHIETLDLREDFIRGTLPPQHEDFASLGPVTYVAAALDAISRLVVGTGYGSPAGAETAQEGA